MIKVGINGGHDDVVDAVGWLSSTSIGTSDGPDIRKIETKNPDIFGSYYELTKWELGYYTAFRFMGTPVIRPERSATIQVTA